MIEGGRPQLEGAGRERSSRLCDPLHAQVKARAQQFTKCSVAVAGIETQDTPFRPDWHDGGECAKMKRKDEAHEHTGRQERDAGKAG